MSLQTCQIRTNVVEAAGCSEDLGRVTVTYRLEPKQHRAVLPKEKPKPSPRQPRPTDRTARMLALAHQVEALVEAGHLTDYAAAAGALGITRARMTQVMNLVMLTPEIQERLLLGELRTPERQLRRLLSSADWGAQESLAQNSVRSAGQAAARQFGTAPSTCLPPPCVAQTPIE